jgi:hypothetical protein
MSDDSVLAGFMGSQTREIDRLRAEISEKDSLITELRSEVERLTGGIKQAIEGFERPGIWVDGNAYPVWEDAADHLREFYLGGHR